MNLDKYEGIIFDMDGTLVDSMPQHSVAWRRTCEHFGYPFDKEYMWSLGGVPTQKIAVMLNDKFKLQHDPVEVAKVKRNFWLEDKTPPEIIDVTFDIFNKFIDKMPIGVGTGSARAHAEQMLGEHGILAKLSALVTADDVTDGKPHPETFLSVAEQMNVAPEKCVVFEDTQIGYQAAKNAGMDCILVENNQLRFA